MPQHVHLKGKFSSIDIYLRTEWIAMWYKGEALRVMQVGYKELRYGMRPNAVP